MCFLFFTRHGLEVFGQQLLVGVEDSGVRDDNRGTDLYFLLPFHDAHT